MSDVAIQVADLAKQYRIGARQAAYRTLREALVDAAYAPARRLRAAVTRAPTDRSAGDGFIWALDDVSFEVKQGEVVGIIGRNGAGKSTLLKILSRITRPTRGYARIHGRVGSLLEVGTGFHHELTGRENIYLNGAILGMKRAEIERRFDEIVAFAEVERFIDTPVKHYSSGMYLRLAFAVAAHLEPEILLVDEVLAVGDAAFQRKCLGKMGDVAKQGRTVLFVSHNMGAIQGLCGRAILIEQGSLAQDGPTAGVIEHYMRQAYSQEPSAASLFSEHDHRPGSELLLHEVGLYVDGNQASAVQVGGALTILASFRSETEIRNPRFGISIEDRAANRLLALSPTLQAPGLFPENVREGVIECSIPCLHLLPGTYYISLILGSGARDLDNVDRAISFTVESADVYASGNPPRAGHGIYFEPAVWSLSGPNE